jgi:hypothetical protein
LRTISLSVWVDRVFPFSESELMVTSGWIEKKIVVKLMSSEYHKRVETCILKSRNYTSIYRYISGDYDESCFYTSGSVSAIPDAS